MICRLRLKDRRSVAQRQRREVFACSGVADARAVLGRSRRISAARSWLTRSSRRSGSPYAFDITLIDGALRLISTAAGG